MFRLIKPNMSFSQQMQQINIDSETFFQRFRLLKPNMGFRQQKGFIPGWIVQLVQCVKVSISQSLIHSVIVCNSFFRKTVPIVPIVQLSKLSEHQLLMNPPPSRPPRASFSNSALKGLPKNLDVDL